MKPDFMSTRQFVAWAAGEKQRISLRSAMSNLGRCLEVAGGLELARRQGSYRRFYSMNGYHPEQP